MSTVLKIGDVLPFPGECDREAARHARRRTGLTERMARSRSNNQRAKLARLILAELDQRRQREADPVEQAASYLRKRGFVVFNQGAIDCKTGTGYIVGRHRFASSAELIAYAEARGWKKP